MNATRRITRTLGFALLLLPVLSAAVLAAGPWENLFVPSLPDIPGQMAFDAARNRIVALGTSHSPNEVRTLTPGDSLWASLATTGTVPSGSWVGYDPARDRLISIRYDNGELWELPFSTHAWAKLTTTGSGPGAFPPYAWFIFVDVARDRIVAAGDDSPTEGYTLTLAGTPNWTHFTVANAPASYMGAAVLDTAGNRIVLFGGCTSLCFNESYYSNRTYALSLDTWQWSAIVPASTLLPAGRSYHTALYDPPRQRMIVFGGRLPTGQTTNQVWALTLSGSPEWTPLGTVSSPSPREGNQAFYDPDGDRMLHVDTEVWAFDLDSPWWTELYPNLPEVSPSPPAEGILIADPQLDRLLWSNGAGAAWELTFDGAPWWAQSSIPGALPPDRSLDVGYTTVFDPARRRLILFGGYDGSHCYNDVWEYAVDGGTEWTQILPLGTPPPVRAWHAAVMDTANDRMIVAFGGCDVQKNDVWELSFAGPPAWTQLTPAGTPPSARQRATAVYDGSRMIVFGGTPGSAKLNDTWTLSLDGPPVWTQLAPAGPLPPGRVNHSAVYDAAGNQMVIFAGAPSGPALNDAWGLALSGSPAWTNLTPVGTSPSPGVHYAAAYDRIRGRMVVYRDHQTWALPLTAPVSAPIPGERAGTEFALSVSPNPARGGADIQLRLAQPAEVTVDVFDVAGRRVAAVFRGPRGAGLHRFRWTPGELAGAGMYVVRATAGAEKKVARVVWTP